MATIRKSSGIKMASITLPPVLICIAILFTLMTKNQLVKYKKIQQELIAKTQEVQQRKQFNDFISNNQTNLEKIGLSLPNEAMMVSVLQDLESVLKKYDPAAVYKFSSSTPTKTNTSLTIPMTLSIKLPLTNLSAFFNDIYSLPYIFQVMTIESQISNNEATHVIGMRVYVQDPFTGYWNQDR